MLAVQLGVFLCMRCAAIHRKLGTHITKVKSLSMDSWSNDQVEVNIVWRQVIDLSHMVTEYEAGRQYHLEPNVQPQ